MDKRPQPQGRDLRVELVCMPWQTLAFPSLAIATLSATVKAQRPRHSVVQRHAHIAWVKHLESASGGLLGVDEYGQIVDRGLMHGLGDWVFAPALYGEEGWFREKLADYVRSHLVEGPDVQLMSRMSAAFCDGQAEQITLSSPDIVGFSSVFAQNLPSLAVAARVKAARPDTKIVFGGANCDGPMGIALHRSFPFVDFVVRGEGEHALIELLDLVSSSESDFASVGGLVWRDSSGGTVANKLEESFVDLDASPVPDFEPFFDQLDGTNVWPKEQVRIPMESSRGCWWGAKKHCTFCGLNGSAMTYRRKSPTRFLSEVESYLGCYPSFEFAMADNILDPLYLTEVMPELGRRDYDIRIHYEIKANLSSTDVESLRQGGVTKIQPGIESLSTPVLALMRKGVSAAQNVALMRDAMENSITVEWNLLYGFPGETLSDYEDMMSQFPALWHLSPPHSAMRIWLERFSPNFDDPEFGFTVRRPRKMYEHLYNLPRAVMMELAFHFEAPPQGISDEAGIDLARSVAEWSEQFENSQLLMSESVDGSLIVLDRRSREADRSFEIPPDWRKVALLLLRDGLGEQALRSRLAIRGHEISGRDIEVFIGNLIEARLLFCDAGKTREQPRYVALPLWSEPEKTC